MKKYLLIGIMFLLGACKKEDQFLDVKANKSDVVPSTIADFQALMDNDMILNESHTGLPDVGNDNYYVLYTTYQSALTTQERSAYVWSSQDFYNGEAGYDWRYQYQKIALANIVLDGLKNIVADAHSAAFRNADGSAHFFRAFAFYELAEEFAKAYDPATAGTDLGIPLKLSSQVQEKISRATVKATYDQILLDLEIAEAELPDVPIYKTRPSRPAALALRSRVLLAMGNYPEADNVATSALLIKKDLLDFNTLNSATVYPFPRYEYNSSEIIFFAQQLGFYINGTNRFLVDPNYYASYNVNDLRKEMFYKDRGKGMSFYGSYVGLGDSFGGLATNELYLIRAECAARAGDPAKAMEFLNGLLVKRYKTGTFVNLSTATAEAALFVVLNERRKEFPRTANLRWNDLRRLNKDPRFAKAITRSLNGVTYTLEPNSSKYVLPIPDEEIRINGLPQNPR